MGAQHICVCHQPVGHKGRLYISRFPAEFATSVLDELLYYEVYEMFVDNQPITSMLYRWVELELD